jgi:hypothetical protein
MTFGHLAVEVARREKKGKGKRAIELNIAELSETLKCVLDVLAELSLSEVAELIARQR